MSNLMKSLSDKEINEFTKEGKGWSPAQCAYYLGLCGVGLPGLGPLDSGTCMNVFKNCGYTPGSGSGGSCGTCTCH